MPWTARLAVVVAALTFTAPASAAVITVETTADPPTSGNGDCELREALAAADNNSTLGGGGGGDCVVGDDVGGKDTVEVPAGTYNITQQLVIGSNVLVHGAGPGVGGTTIDAGSNARVFNIGGGAGVSMALEGIKITNGKAVDVGGGVWSSSPLTLTNVVLTNNDAAVGDDSATQTGPGHDGNPGGGIYATANLTLINSTVSNNRAGSGGTGGSGGGQGGYGGNGGRGGGIYIQGSKLTITNSAITGNTSGQGGVGGLSAGGSNGSPGAGGDGGGIAAVNGDTVITGSTISNNSGAVGGDALANGGYTFGGTGGGAAGILQSGGTLMLTDSAVTGNHTGNSGATGTNTYSALGGYGGTGGGISIGSGAHGTILRSTIASNTTGNGGNSTTNAGSPGNGAGIANQGGAITTVDSSTISGNANGLPGHGISNGFGGYGGGIYNEFTSTLTVTNSTVTDNHVHPSSVASPTDPASGGGIYNANGATATVTQSTIRGNTVGTGNSRGGGIASNHHSGNGNLTLANNIIAGNDSNCSSPDAPITDGSHNVTFGDTTCPGTNADPKLLPLANNGGPTQTMAIDEGSAAIDAVPSSGAGCPAKDQRGVTRPQRTACDAGAYERDIPPPTPQDNSGGGGDQNQTPIPPIDKATPPPTDTGAINIDKTPATIKLACNAKQKLAAALKKGLQCAFTTNEAGTGTVSALKLCSGKASVTKPGTRKLACKFAKKTQKKFAKAKKLRLKLVLVFKDLAGNQSKKTITITLKR